MKRSKPPDCKCGLCKPTPEKQYHPEYGYDLDRVKRVLCLTCSEPIGDEPHEKVLLLARFGQMLFIHKKCKLDW